MQVLDTSVVVKWYKTEEDTDKDLNIRDEYSRGRGKISLPDIIILELANAIRYKENSSPEDVADVLDNFTKLKFDIIIPTIDLVKYANNLAFKYNITIYDAIYIALADELRYEFITADKNLYEKVKELSFVKLLKEF